MTMNAHFVAAQAAEILFRLGASAAERVGLLMIDATCQSRKGARELPWWAQVRFHRLANRPRRSPRRRQALAHRQAANRSDRTDQMQAGRAQGLHRQEIVEQGAV